jgi:hypothetical protein
MSVSIPYTRRATAKGTIGSGWFVLRVRTPRFATAKPRAMMGQREQEDAGSQHMNERKPTMTLARGRIRRIVAMKVPLQIFVCSAALLFAGSAQSQTIQLICKVKWEADCIDPLLNRQKCPPLLNAGPATGALVIEGDKARTKDLGVVTTYAVVRRSANEFAFEGEWSGPGQFVRGHGTLDSAARQLRLYMSLGRHPGDDRIVQRGLVADCR